MCVDYSFSLVPDDATDAKAKLSEVLNKSHNKVQTRALFKSLKTKTSFMSKRMLNIFFNFCAGNLYFLGVMVNDDVDCGTQARNRLWECLGTDDSVVDDDSLMACMVANLSDDCIDLVCEVFSLRNFPYLSLTVDTF